MQGSLAVYGLQSEVLRYKLSLSRPQFADRLAARSEQIRLFTQILACSLNCDRCGNTAEISSSGKKGTMSGHERGN